MPCFQQQQQSLWTKLLIAEANTGNLPANTANHFDVDTDKTKARLTMADEGHFDDGVVFDPFTAMDGLENEPELFEAFRQALETDGGTHRGTSEHGQLDLASSAASMRTTTTTAETDPSTEAEVLLPAAFQPPPMMSPHHYPPQYYATISYHENYAMAASNFSPPRPGQQGARLRQNLPQQESRWPSGDYLFPNGDLAWDRSPSNANSYPTSALAGNWEIPPASSFASIPPRPAAEARAPTRTAVDHASTHSNTGPCRQSDARVGDYRTFQIADTASLPSAGYRQDPQEERQRFRMLQQLPWTEETSVQAAAAAENVYTLPRARASSLSPNPSNDIEYQVPARRQRSAPSSPSEAKEDGGLWMSNFFELASKKVKPKPAEGRSHLADVLTNRELNEELQVNSGGLSSSGAEAAVVPKGTLPMPPPEIGARSRSSATTPASAGPNFNQPQDPVPRVDTSFSERLAPGSDIYCMPTGQIHALSLNEVAEIASGASVDVPTGGNTNDEAAAVGSDAATIDHPMTSTGKVVPLFMDYDEHVLIEYQCLLRKQIELFEATPEDTQATTQGRINSITAGQVGIRCRHCAILPVQSRPRGSVYYSRTIGGIYQVGQNMAKHHFAKTCTMIPEHVKARLIWLRSDHRRASGGGKEYWSEGLRVLGIYEDGNALRFRQAGGL